MYIIVIFHNNLILITIIIVENDYNCNYCSTIIVIFHSNYSDYCTKITIMYSNSECTFVWLYFLEGRLPAAQESVSLVHYRCCPRPSNFRGVRASLSCTKNPLERIKNGRLGGGNQSRWPAKNGPIPKILFDPKNMVSEGAGGEILAP